MPSSQAIQGNTRLFIILEVFDQKEVSNAFSPTRAKYIVCTTLFWQNLQSALA